MRAASRFWSAEIVDAALIEKMAQLRGIGDAYHDYRGELKYFSLETKRQLLRAMGCAVDDPAALRWNSSGPKRNAGANSCLPWRRRARQNRRRHQRHGARIRLGADLVGAVGRRLVAARGDVDRRLPRDLEGRGRGVLDHAQAARCSHDLPPGYHELEAKIAGGTAERCRLIISAPLCYEPAAILAGRKLWGIAVQLYTLRSRDNWGIGDFNDLGALIRWVAPQGAGFIGLIPCTPSRRPTPAAAVLTARRAGTFSIFCTSPCADSGIPGLCSGARAARRSFGGRPSRRAARRGMVDYRAAADLKFEFLEILYRDFRERT